MLRKPVLLLGAALAILVAACSSAPPATAPAPHVVLDNDLAPLRTAFNADEGKVRAIFLASPT